MSKKILMDSEELKSLISKAQDFSYSDVYAKNTDKVLTVLDKAVDLIEDAKRSERFSVLEWHPVSEKPEKGRIILVRHNGKDYPFDAYKVGAFVLDGFDRPNSNIKEWAYLPD